MQTRYPALRRYITETPWALETGSLLLMREILGRRIEGDRLTADEIAEITAAAPQRTKAPSQGAIAVLPLWGMISPHQVSALSSGPTTALDAWLQDFLELVNEPNIGTIVLDIDSPGGAVDLVPEVAAKIRAANAKKEIVAVANTRAASAAYWLAAQAGTLIVSPSGAVGSIGVYAAHEDVSRQLDAEGVTVTLVSAGEHKVDGNPFEPLSDDARATIQENVDAYYRLFVADVAKGRGVDTGRVEASFGQGKMIRADQAVNLGMADGVGSLSDTLDNLVAGKPAVAGRRARALDPALQYAVEFEAGQVIGFSGSVGLGANTAATSTGYAGVAKTIREITTTMPGLARAAALELDRAIAENAPLELEHLELHEDSGGTTAVAGSAAPPATNQPKEITVDYASIEDLIARRDAIAAEMTDLDKQAAGRALNEDEQATFTALTTELDGIEAAIASINTRRRELARIARTTPEGSIEVVPPGEDGAGFNVNWSRLPENLYDLGSYRKHAGSFEELQARQRDGALKIAEQIRFVRGSAADQTAAKDRLERMMDGDEKAELARRVIVTASPEYDRAFGKALMRGRDALTHQEDSLIKAAVTESGLGSETPVPITIDPTVMLTSNGQTNPLRAVADVRTITGLTWRGLTSAGITAAYESAETNQVADGTPTFGGGDISVLRVDAYVPFSIEVDMDWPQLRAELAKEFADSKDVLEGVKFFTGTGTNEPLGLITGTTATQVVKTATTAVFAYTDPKLAANALPVRWDSDGQWFAAKAVWSDLEDLLAAAGNSDPFSFAADGGAAPRQVVGAQGNTGRVYRGYPMNYASAMDTAVTTSGKNVMVIGDPDAFVIVDRIGMNIELIPQVFGANNRPTGQRGLYAYWRNNTGIRTASAFEVLQIR